MITRAPRVQPAISGCRSRVETTASHRFDIRQMRHRCRYDSVVHTVIKAFLSTVTRINTGKQERKGGESASRDLDLSVADISCWVAGTVVTLRACPTSTIKLRSSSGLAHIPRFTHLPFPSCPFEPEPNMSRAPSSVTTPVKPSFASPALPPHAMIARGIESCPHCSSLYAAPCMKWEIDFSIIPYRPVLTILRKESQDRTGGRI